MLTASGDCSGEGQGYRLLYNHAPTMKTTWTFLTWWKGQCPLMISYCCLKCPTVTSNCRTIVLSILKNVQLPKVGKEQKSDAEIPLGKTLSDAAMIEHARSRIDSATEIAFDSEISNRLQWFILPSAIGHSPIAFKNVLTTYIAIGHFSARCLIDLCYAPTRGPTAYHLDRTI